MIDIKAPTFPESVPDGTVAVWHRQVGDPVRRDEILADIETEKVVLEIVAPADGKLAEILRAEGDTVESGELIARFEAGAVEAAPAPETPADTGRPARASPAARKLAEENGIDVAAIDGSGRDGRVTREDVARLLEAGPTDRAADAPAPPTPASVEEPLPDTGERVERRVPMTRLRASVARRLVEAQRNAAMLTTFNEVNMQPVMTMRKRYRDEFERVHNGVRLGFMSFFVRACVEALKRFPAVNASVDGNDILYHGYYDIGVAVSTDRGLVVPVLRDADALSLAQIEDQIAGFGERARENRLTIEEMSGGTFTISNGGVFGSLLSTPILNPPQTAILGMHKIEDRPVAVDGQVVILPMMYLALSYDHRLIDGQEAVRFLVTVKALIEDPARILLEL
ncbi:MAG: 2-oxoglutarate dehydrogenase complex dihydrolipoyllysine-residue succinyltransferase [Gammaproteobacteria bacterium]|nr:2-oxoglutarate dehydrogenase complex dihydrolipoyllysine-residue succinyltransferase [Gammaproteobacteria bacterium]